MPDKAHILISVIILCREVRKVTQEQEQAEALRRIVTEYPMYTTSAIQIIKDKGDLVDFLSILDSY